MPEMIPVVLDTNIFVSALISPRGNEAAALGAAKIGRLLLCFSLDIISEYELVLCRPKLKFDRSEVQDTLAFIRREGRLTSVPIGNAISPMTSPDPSDTMFIACAIAANAAFLVTGNRRHFPEPRYGTAQVVNARDLLARLPAS